MDKKWVNSTPKYTAFLTSNPRMEDRCRASLAAISEGPESSPSKPAASVVPANKEWTIDSRDGYSVPSLFLRRANLPHLRGTLVVQVKGCSDVNKVSGTQLVSTKISIGPLKSKLNPQKLTQNHVFEDNNFNFSLAGNEDFLRIRLTAATVLKENCGVAKISIPVLLQMLCPDMSPEAARQKRPQVAADDSKRPTSPTSAGEETKRVLSVVESSTLPPHLKASLVAQLNQDLSSSEFYEAWFRLGKGDKRSEHCGSILLRMKFNPDWATAALPPKITEASSGLSSAETRSARAEKMKVTAEKARTTSVASPKNSAAKSPQQKLALLQQLEPSIAKKIPKFFGCTLAQAAEFSVGTQIPIVITDCVNFLKENGMKEEGIFRVPGSNDSIQTLKDSYEQSKDETKTLAFGTLALKSSKVAGPHEIGGLLKLYLRSLPEPIFPFATYGPLLMLTDNIKVTSAESPTGALLEQVKELKALLMKMPQQNLDTVRFLLVFLSSVSELSAVNLMEVKNLAIVFAPTVLRPAPEKDSSEEMALMTDLLSEMPRTINAMEVMIRLGKHLFPNTPPPRLDNTGRASVVETSRTSPPPLPAAGRPLAKSMAAPRSPTSASSPLSPRGSLPFSPPK